MLAIQKRMPAIHTGKHASHTYRWACQPYKSMLAIQKACQPYKSMPAMQSMLAMQRAYQPYKSMLAIQKDASHTKRASHTKACYGEHGQAAQNMMWLASVRFSRCGEIHHTVAVYCRKLRSFARNLWNSDTCSPLCYWFQVTKVTIIWTVFEIPRE